MPESPLAAIIGRLVRGLPPTDGTADAALLARFIGWRDEAAFELLVYRHGPMVRGLCRRVLRHEQDAEDAFQATFLALAKKAATIRGQSLAGWLYRVAFHAALKAKARSARRETVLPEIAAPATALEDGIHNRELAAALDEEILRLPERFRLPVVLCYLQGRSNREVAATLGIPKGTVDSRLATARQRLRDRLLRRGLAPAIAGMVMEGVVESAELPGSVVRAVTKAAVAFLSKQAGVPATAAILAEGVLQTMYVTKIKWALAVALTLAVLGSGAGVATYEAVAGGQAPGVPEEKAKPPAKPQAAAKASTDTPVFTADFNPTDSAVLCGRLQQPITIDKEVPATPLKDVLDFLSDKYKVTFIVDVQTFEQAGFGGGRNVQDTQVSLPKMPGVSLSTALRFLLAQINGTFLVRRDYIEITTLDRQVKEAVGQDVLPANVQTIDFFHTVNLAFDRVSLEKAIANLAAQSGANIVLDPRVQEKEKLLVTGTFLNTPMTSAIRVIADMVGLQSVKIGNVYYVTTRDNADRLRKLDFPEDEAPAPPSAKPVPGPVNPVPAKPPGQ